MPFVLPYSLLQSNRLALVLAYGRLSVLEACAILGRSVQRAEAPDERVSVLDTELMDFDRLTRLAGAHKAGPLVEEVASAEDPQPKLTDLLSSFMEDNSNLSLSAYGVEEDDYEGMVRSLLDGVRGSGLKKTRLLRPRNMELMAEEVVSRDAVDVLAFPFHGGFGLGPTVWVPESEQMRRRGTRKPMPHSDISLSPRLARVLLNLAGLEPGHVVLDPFCGSGTILAEGYSMSLRCLGLDISASRVQDARENIRWSGGGTNLSSYDIRKGDARYISTMLRGTKVDAVVTEPLLLPRIEARPKTATARALLDEAGAVYSQALASMADSVLPGGRIVIVVPIVLTMEGDEVSFALEGRKLGLKLFQPGPVGFEYPIRLSFESTRWVKRGVYVFESRS